jgi:hypothetical protein
LFTPECLRLGYDNVHTMFPQFPFLAELLRKNASIYVSRDKIIRPGVNYGYSTLAFLRGWMQSAAAIPEGWIRRLAMRDVFKGRQFRQMLVYALVTERMYRPGRYRGEYGALLKSALVCSPFNFARLLLFAPLLFMPDFLQRQAWEAFAAHRRRQGKPVPQYDELR